MKAQICTGKAAFKVKEKSHDEVGVNKSLLEDETLIRKLTSKLRTYK